jgi:hypothetical protein
MAQNEDAVPTPREFDYWKLLYRELALLPDWPDLSAEARARKLLEGVEEELAKADAPPQRKALFNCPGEQRLKVARRMIEHFEDEDRS